MSSFRMQMEWHDLLEAGSLLTATIHPHQGWNSSKVCLLDHKAFERKIYRHKFWSKDKID